MVVGYEEHELVVAVHLQDKAAAVLGQGRELLPSEHLAVELDYRLPARVVQGVGRTGRLVTSAALILFLAFATLASGPEVTVKVFATALGAGILLDATVVRALLVPALVSLFGRWNWWLPSWAARLLRVEPSPATTEALPIPVALEREREIAASGAR